MSCIVTRKAPKSKLYSMTRSKRKEKLIIYHRKHRGKKYKFFRKRVKKRLTNKELLNEIPYRQIENKWREKRHYIRYPSVS